MFHQIVDYLKKELSYFDLICKKYNENTFYFESEKLHIAFDIVFLGDNIAIDLVLRKNFQFIESIRTKYPEIKSNKARLITSNIRTDKNIFFNCIKLEFLELTYLFGNQNINKIYYKDNLNNLRYEEPLKFWFYDAVPNFGDFMSPWLAQHFTNRPVINVRTHQTSEGAILGVGSIVQSITPNHKNIKIWGSGIITDKNSLKVANNLKKSNLKFVNACRGELTNDFFRQYGFKTSGILGDPGLLFGNIYTPKNKNKYKYAIVPHYVHYQYFKNLNIDDCVIVNVRNELTTVIDQISSAEKVISTSLHGLIIAQSYHIPWLHLYVNDGRLLVGEEFKFEDFFSILNRDQVAQQKIMINDITFNNIMKLFHEVKHPKFKNNYSEQNLIESFFESLAIEENPKKTVGKNNTLPSLVFLGDSHINYFKYGADHGLYKPFGAHVCMASGATVLGLNNNKSFTMAGDKYKTFIQKFEKKSELIFQLGEVDCGILIWLKAQENGISVEEQAKLCILSYEKFLSDIIGLGYRNITVTSATVPTINDEDYVGEVISLRRQKVTASFIERTDLTIYFNKLLKKLCEKLDINYIDQTNIFINKETGVCKEKYRNKNKGDHHMDNIAASSTWADEINKYLLSKYNIPLTEIDLECIHPSCIKSHRIHSSLLSDSLKIEAKLNSKIKAYSYYEDDYYIYSNKIAIDGIVLDKKLKLIFKKHYALK